MRKTYGEEVLQFARRAAARIQPVVEIVDLDVGGGFEWDERKNNANLDKHGIDFEDAVGIFYGQVMLRRSDRNNEERW